MQRVLSFQMARGLGEPSEFVTKRMCFSFLFSVGFLCLLCGFLLGRFAAERAIETRAEKKRLEFAGNGLLGTEHLQHFLLDELERAPDKEDGEMNLGTMGGSVDDVSSVANFLANLSLFHSISLNKTSIVATVRGAREPDRFVVVSANAEGISVALQLSKALNHIHAEYNWRSRRTLIFCIFYGNTDSCPALISGYVQRGIMGYLVIHGDNLQGGDYFAVSGSDVVQYVVLKTVEVMSGAHVRNSHSSLDSYKPSYYKHAPLRLALDIPHAIFSFVEANQSTVNRNRQEETMKSRHNEVAQILGQTVWTLSESLALQWKSKYLYRTINEVLSSMNSTEFTGIKEEIKTVLTRLSSTIDTIYEKIGVIEDSKPLEIRMLNDLIMDLDKALLCSDTDYHSRTDLVELMNSIDKTPDIKLMRLRDILNCYKTAARLIENW